MESLISLENFTTDDPERIDSHSVLLYNEYDTPSSIVVIYNRCNYAKQCVSRIFSTLKASLKNKSSIIKHTDTDIDYEPLVEMLADSSKITITKVVMQSAYKCTIYLDTWTTTNFFVIENDAVIKYFSQEINPLGVQ